MHTEPPRRTARFEYLLCRSNAIVEISRRMRRCSIACTPLMRVLTPAIVRSVANTAMSTSAFLFSLDLFITDLVHVSCAELATAHWRFNLEQSCNKPESIRCLGSLWGAICLMVGLPVKPVYMP